MRRVNVTPKPRSRMPIVAQLCPSSSHSPNSSEGRCRNSTGSNTRPRMMLIPRPNQLAAAPKAMRFGDTHRKGAWPGAGRRSGACVRRAGKHHWEKFALSHGFVRQRGIGNPGKGGLTGCRNGGHGKTLGRRCVPPRGDYLYNRSRGCFARQNHSGSPESRDLPPPVLPGKLALQSPMARAASGLALLAPLSPAPLCPPLPCACFS